MKYKTYLLLVLGLLLSVTACHKTFPVDPKGDHVVTSMNDLVVSDNFSWKTTKDVAVIINLPTNSSFFLPISINNESGSRTFFIGYPEKGADQIKTKITIPSYISKLQLSFREASGMDAVTVGLTGNNLLYDLTSGQKSVAVPCDLSGFLTYSQGGWGSPANGNNPGAVRDAYFTAVFPSGLEVGDPSNFTIHFSDDVVMLAAPMEGSEYAAFVNQAAGFSFVVNHLKKANIDVEVILFSPADYDKFGFDIDVLPATTIREQKFVGLILPKNPADYVNSLYLNQSTGLQNEMPAIFSIDVF